MKKESTNKQPVSVWIYLLVAVLAVIVGFSWGEKRVRMEMEKEVYPDNPKSDQKRLLVGDAEVMVEVRDDNAGRELGLSGREGLGENEGMLFVFDEQVRPTFWMKDMRFDLDMVWISEMKIVQVDEQVKAPTKENPRISTATPIQPVEMILEVRAGWIQENEVKLGDGVAWVDEVDNN